MERKKFDFEFCFVSQVDGIADMAGGAELVNKLNSLEVENKNLKKGNRSQFLQLIFFLLRYKRKPLQLSLEDVLFDGCSLLSTIVCNCIVKICIHLTERIKILATYCIYS